MNIATDSTSTDTPRIEIFLGRPTSVTFLIVPQLSAATIARLGEYDGTCDGGTTVPKTASQVLEDPESDRPLTVRSEVHDFDTESYFADLGWRNEMAMIRDTLESYDWKQKFSHRVKKMTMPLDSAGEHNQGSNASGAPSYTELFNQMLSEDLKKTAGRTQEEEAAERGRYSGLLRDQAAHMARRLHNREMRWRAEGPCGVCIVPQGLRSSTSILIRFLRKRQRAATILSPTPTFSRHFPRLLRTQDPQILLHIRPCGVRITLNRPSSPSSACTYLPPYSTYPVDRASKLFDQSSAPLSAQRGSRRRSTRRVPAVLPDQIL